MADDEFNEIKADWDDGQMVVAIQYPSNLYSLPNITIALAQVETFTARISTPHDINDSLNNHNMGKIKKPARFTFDLNVFPHGKAVDLLNKIQLGDRYFDLVMAPAKQFDVNVERAAGVGQPAGSVWVVGRAIFRGAFVNDNSGRFSIGGKPITTYSCGALQYVFDKNQDGEGSYIIIGNGFDGPSATEAEIGLSNNLLRDSGGPAPTPPPAEPGSA